MPLRTESIKAFLLAKTHSDLAALYNANMECQVNVAQDNGTRIEGEYHGKTWVGWTDGIQTWKAIRIPYAAHSEPHYEDKPMSFDLAAHAEGIGLTGWDWRNKLSRWVAFDFDAIAGHPKAGLSQQELNQVIENANRLDWITIRRSASGNGIHLYVPVTPTQTINHNEHAALARAILGQMSAMLKFDFNAKVDICGQNIWIWHRKMSLPNRGLTLIKKGGVLNSVPQNWQDHLKVITGHRRKTLPRFTTIVDDATSEAESSFSQLSSQILRVPLDDEHKKLLNWLEENKTYSWFDADHHMLITHTAYLKRAHIELNLRGTFETLSQGTDWGQDKNCFCSPLSRGGWVVRRYSMGVQEHPSWEQDKGWTKCYYNTDPTLRNACMLGTEDTDGAYVFNESKLAIQAAEVLGVFVPKLPVSLEDKPAKIKAHKDGRLILEIEGDQNAFASKEMQGWLHKRGKWIRIFNAQSSQPESDIIPHDDVIRHLISEDGKDYGWVIKDTDGSWRDEPLVHVRSALKAMNFGGKEIDSMIGSSVVRAWKLVNHPFQPEHPGDRLWNRGAAQLRFVPNFESDSLSYPHWSMILNHIGQNLNQAVSLNSWCQSNGLVTGADYLKLWIASLFKEPMQPLPYLFLYGGQNTGKSILHEALSLLMTKGYQRAEAALINQSNFNEELRNAVLCVVEELNLRREKAPASRIKDFVTARELLIHPKNKTPYCSPNTTHWLQCSNDSNYCPILYGDTRIVMIRVDQLTDSIPKKQLIPLLEKEAPDFLAEILRIEIPQSPDRLNIPIVESEEKKETVRSNRSPLELFLETRCYESPGSWIKFSDLYNTFIESLDADELNHWSKQKFGKELPPQFPKGRNRKDAQFYIGNISLVEPTEPSTKRYRAIQEKNFVWLELESISGNGQHDIKSIS